MGNYNAVLFDLDGTLIDTSEGVIESTKYVVESFKLPPLSLEQILSFIGPPLVSSFKRIYGFDDERALECATKWRECYSNGAIYHASPYPGMKELLNTLKDKGIKIGVATYKREDFAKELLAHLGLAEYFNEIKGADKAGVLTKADIIKLCAEALTLDGGNEILMIGDSENDAIGAQQMKVDFLAVTYGFGFKTQKDVDEFPNVGFSKTVEGILDFI